MLFICIPAYNEAPTVGLLLWRIRKVLEEHPREYELLVLDDGSTDATREILAPYAEVLPLTVLRNEQRQGYAAALDQLVRAASARTRYPRRDALLLMQADFTDQPEHIPELVKRFDGGADLVVAQRKELPAAAPRPVRVLSRAASWVLRPFRRVDGVSDPLGTMRLVRVAVARDAIRDADGKPLASHAGWAANAELLMRLARAARRIETVEVTPRYDLRSRETRVRPWESSVALWRFGVASRAFPTEPAAPPPPRRREPRPAATTATTAS
jgi:glycosyltransferase involved in cell wall biosynthesis